MYLFNLNYARQACQLFSSRSGMFNSNVSKTLQLCRNCSKSAPLSIKEVNTNVSKDIILYKNENERFFRMLNFFGITQYLFWGYLGYFSHTSLRDAPVDRSKITPETPWYAKVNLGDNKYRNTLTGVSIILGFGMLACTWMYTLRSVRYLILHKGGKSVSFVTYAPFGRNRIMKVDLKYISCDVARRTEKIQIPIKVQNKWLFYLVDMRGEFRNPQIFDYTVGLRRSFRL